jgi:hypothetical protein
LGSAFFGVCPRWIANKVAQFQRSKLSRPNLSSPLRTTRILLVPESTGRASGRRPNGFRGWSSGKRLSVVFSDASHRPGQVPCNTGRSHGGEGSANAAGMG